MTIDEAEAGIEMIDHRVGVDGVDGGGGRSFSRGEDYSGTSFGRRDDRGGGGGGGGWDTGRSRFRREDDPFARQEQEEAEAGRNDPDAEATKIFTGENSGLDFDMYEDIPVETSGRDIPEPITSFTTLDLGASINANIKRCKFKNPTPVQKYAIPVRWRSGLMACAQTGSGKTAAFCFPIIAGILKRGLQGVHMNRKTYPLALVFAHARIGEPDSRRIAEVCVPDGRRVVRHLRRRAGVEQFRAMERGATFSSPRPGG